MDEFIRALGFRELSASRTKLGGFVKSAVAESGPHSWETGTDDGRSKERYRYCGKRFGVTSYSSIGKDGAMRVKRWDAFAEAGFNIPLNDIAVERGSDGLLYAYCEDGETGGDFEFRLNNVVEYKKHWKSYIAGARPFTANVAGLASYGTIILPVERTERSEQARENEMREYRSLLERARSGDETACDSLNERADEMSRAVRERLKSEDLLSVFEGYLLPVGDDDGVFAVLGEILAIDRDANSLTGEEILTVTLDINESKIDVFVNAADVLGMPMEGMRFMGVCRLQGRIVF